MVGNLQLDRFMELRNKKDKTPRERAEYHALWIMHNSMFGKNGATEWEKRFK